MSWLGGGILSLSNDISDSILRERRHPMTHKAAGGIWKIGILRYTHTQASTNTRTCITKN